MESRPRRSRSSTRSRTGARPGPGAAAPLGRSSEPDQGGPDQLGAGRWSRAVAVRRRAARGPVASQIISAAAETGRRARGSPRVGGAPRPAGAGWPRSSGVLQGQRRLGGQRRDQAALAVTEGQLAVAPAAVDDADHAAVALERGSGARARLRCSSTLGARWGSCRGPPRGRGGQRSAVGEGWSRSALGDVGHDPVHREGIAQQLGEARQQRLADPGGRPPPRRRS